MIFHASIPSDHPRRTAEAIAALWGGRAYPFPLLAEGSWVALAGDNRGSIVEVLPRGTEFHRLSGEHCLTVEGEPSRHGAYHLLISTALDVEDVIAIAIDKGFHAHAASHAGLPVIEFWIDDCFLLEVLTPAAEAIYRGSVSFAAADAMIAQMGGMEALAA